MTYRGLRIALAASVVALCPIAPAAAVPPSRRAAFEAADAMMADEPVAANPGVPVCAAPPPTGRKIAGDMVQGAEGHSIEIQNGKNTDALVKIRHANTGKLAGSFYIRKFETMKIEGVPDGVYVIQYAFGPALAANCRSLTRITRARAIPGSDTLKTETVDDAEHTEVKRMTVSYQIGVPQTAGNVPTVAIDAATFNAD